MILKEHKTEGTKMCIDIIPANRAILDKIKEDNPGTTYTQIVNNMIKTFGNLPDALRCELGAFVAAMYETKVEEYGTAFGYHKEELDKQIASCKHILDFLNFSVPVNVDETNSALATHLMKDGYLVCPENWIIVNPEAASNSMYACVLECRNFEAFGNTHFGRPIPHFVCYTSVKYGKDFDDAFYNDFSRLCVQAWPDFNTVLDMQVEPVKDPDKPGRVLNEKEWVNAPTLGFFAVYEEGDPVRPHDYEPPYGARIVRTCK